MSLFRYFTSIRTNNYLLIKKLHRNKKYIQLGSKNKVIKTKIQQEFDIHEIKI